MEEIITNKDEVGLAKKHQILNICVVGFVIGLTFVSLIAFLVSIFNNENAYSIASIYILAMLLGIPTLKVFLDKAKHSVMKKLNITGIIFGFGAIFIITIMMVIDLAWPALF